jgi:CRP-like cAMP-binding protein
MADLSGNLLLDALAAPVRSECVEAAERIRVAVGEEVIRQGDKVTSAFFPASAACSLTIGLKSGDKAECATVGAEGVIGLSLMNGARRSSFSAVVQVAGEGYLLPLELFADLMHRHRGLRDAVFVYTGFALNALGRSVACNSFHSIVERMARWLLMVHDRVEGDELSLTHNTLSQMLAATRPRVSLAAAKLRAAHLIDYQRGVVRIRDRKGLEQVACECYEATKKYEQTLPWMHR